MSVCSYARPARTACCAVLLLLLSPPSLHAQGPANPVATSDLGQIIADTIQAEPFDGAFWGVQVVNLRSGTVLYAHNARQNFVPASNVKLFTSAAALDRLGPEYQYRTRVYAEGPVEDGTLKGNLIVRGQGDPTIGGYEQRDDPTQVFRRWADSLRAAGITHIAGNIIGDDEWLDETPLGHGWSWSDISYAYAAELGGLVFNENTVDLRIRGRQARDPARVTWEPFETDYVQVVNRSRTVPYSEEEDEEYQRLMGTNTIHVQTRVHPKGRETESITITDPTRYFVHTLRQVLLKEGISVDGHPADLDDTALAPAYEGDDLRPVASYASPPLADIVETLNHESKNLYAEQLLRTLAVETPPEGGEDLPEGSSPLGIKAVRETLAAAAVDTSQVQLADGSGLSRQNLASPRSLIRVLRYMWLHENPTTSSAFHDALPEGGTDGTLEYRFRGGAPAGGNVRAKTGTLSNVSGLSGYVTAQDGTPLAFSVLCNHHAAESSTVRSAQDAIVNALSRLSL